MKRSVVLAAVALSLPSLVVAQAQGRVKGLVRDTEGDPVAAATVIVTCPEIANYRRETTTDGDGVFSVLIVDGTKRYLFRVEASGYEPVERIEKPLIGGRTLEVRFTLATLQRAREQAQDRLLEQPGYKELQEGRKLLGVGKRAEAREKFAAAVALKPDLPPGWQQLGVVDLEDGLSAQALQEAQKCLELASAYAPCLALAANAARACGETALYGKYMAAYKLANPTDPAILFNDVVPLLNRGDYAGAEPLLKKILEVAPDFPDALYQMGVIGINKGVYPEALTYLEHFLSVAPEHRDAATAKGMVDWLKGQGQ
jgi:tetratricopeptide (TPR) repeat protein